MPQPPAPPTGGNFGTSGRSSGGDDDDGTGATVAIVVVVMLLLIGAMVAAAVVYKKKQLVPGVNKLPTQWPTDGRNGYAAHENPAYDESYDIGGGGTSARKVSTVSTGSVVLGADGTFRQGHAAE